MIDETRLTNHFLIAMPSLEDGNFSQSVTYICEHDENGALGITINRPSEIDLAEIFSQLQINVSSDHIKNQTVLNGGPVQIDRGFILHTPTGTWESSLKVTDTIAVTTSQDVMQAIANGEGPARALIALGYSGWGPGQLEHEISENSWLSCPATEEILFDVPLEKRWRAAALLLGIDLQLLSNQAGHA
ncbi:MAG TPA: YqgE/AlgH family protein [Gammaproteobacteria bacterium]|nr:YqgE/AlgH family protein [Gammaproteobacteria bacterium]